MSHLLMGVFVFFYYNTNLAIGTLQNDRTVFQIWSHPKLSASENMWNIASTQYCCFLISFICCVTSLVPLGRTYYSFSDLKTGSSQSKLKMYFQHLCSLSGSFFSAAADLPLHFDKIFSGFTETVAAVGLCF